MGLSIHELIARYPGYVPVIVSSKSSEIKLHKHKYFVSGDVSLGQFMVVLRKHIDNIDPSHGLYLFVRNVLPTASTPLSLIHKEHHVDQVLYLTICKENTFG
jgi:Autophagy protein Atg8 ubiquitin like